MGIGIHICGLNGCGKSTLGRALADRIGFHYIDSEYLYFSKSDTHKPYTNPQSRQDVQLLLVKEVNKYGNFVFAAVKGDYGEEIVAMYDYVIMIDVPREIRLQRVRERSSRTFGARIQRGGDMYEQEEAFIQMVESRQDTYVDQWVQTMKCPVIRVDGTKSIEENIKYIIEQLNS